MCLRWPPLISVKAEAADTDLQQIADALDVSTIKTFQFTANGTSFQLGQSTSPAAAWPRQFVKSLTRVYDFTAGAMRDEWVRMSAETPSVGPEQQTVALVSGNFAWNESGKNAVPQPHQVTSRAHDLAISPHGLLRAAFANSAAVGKKTIDGRSMTVISFTDRGKHKVVAYANDQNAIERSNLGTAIRLLATLKSSPTTVRIAILPASSSRPRSFSIRMTSRL